MELHSGTGSGVRHVAILHTASKQGYDCFVLR